ncbi:CsbD family protein [Corynebacterium anserum]|uniref:CsbD family protein n=1 Tax=Corynebacterium anserum TaxID=2684406 RepID=A0A7G7YMN7_9CORY|nr:CsbD family protein [Corynebacterium anserum]MBC2681130.1 CsbD family protein [Corynebacterium anserum]QNH95757.1 CsbD family protein [Corynebacterium anserum]
MSTDELKNKAENLGGKAKEGLGEATGNDSLKDEGRADQTKAGIKEKANEAKNKIADAANKLIGDAGE